ncbi:MAG TPA: FAD-dependent oxidoreductase, partial [Spirochaetota bacterium]|nr:FAD-dependent oxidoreductase [Spirochaetota bacterium]
MKEYIYDSVIIGGGAAGIASAIEIDKNNFKTAIIEREESLGGILNQCIHNGFGLHTFKEELTGPEYAEKFIDIAINSNIEIFKNTTVTNLINNDDFKTLHCYGKDSGVFIIKTKTIVLAMGCRERNRGNIAIAGERPAGIFTAGLAQRLINIDGYIPGKEAVILGSGDIGLIMARRLTLSGCKVHCVVEIQKYPSGLTRNIVQCLNDFDIPLYLSHSITKITGKNRIKQVEITPIEENKPNMSKSFTVNCDTLLLSVGLIPENELSKKIGIQLNSQTNGAFVDSTMMTNIDGVFACGNVLHVHDLADYAVEEAQKTGKFVVNYLKNIKIPYQYKVVAGNNLRYIIPNKYNPYETNKFYFRSMVVKNDAQVEIKLNNQTIKKINKNHIKPSEMISIILEKDDFTNINNDFDNEL